MTIRYSDIAFAGLGLFTGVYVFAAEIMRGGEN